MSKKLLAAVLALSLVMSLLFVPAAAATTFDDVAADHWAASSIEKWAGYGVLQGNGDGTFAPDVVMTRAEFAAMLVKMLGLTEKSESSFTDTADHWAAEFISIAVKAGIINGVGDNKFDPDEPIDFTQAAVMMCRAFGLAQNKGGDDWAKESIDKLTSLGMIGEGADEHLQVDVKCDRAVVAKLADTMVAEYVAEDRATPITGEVNGVILVVKGAKAEIKDATLVAPVVAESATVTLTNTKADAVIVSGKDAAVTADEQSTVASVVLAGEAPKADIKGEVASVTVAEETKGAVIEAPKAADNAIVNNSGTDITVNGETVSNKADDTPNNPADTTASDTTKTDEHVHSFVYAIVPVSGENAAWNGTQHTKSCSGAAKCKFVPVKENCTIVYVQTTKTVDSKTVSAHYKKCSVCKGAQTSEDAVACTFKNGVCVCGARQTIDNGNAPAGHEHVWSATTSKDAKLGYKAATCTKDGLNVYTCTAKIGEGDKAVSCTATRSETVPATGHTWKTEGADANGWKITTPATCAAQAVYTRECNNEGCGYKETKRDGDLSTEHNYEGVTTYTNLTATQHSQVCTVCKKAIAVNHTWGTDANAGKCTKCGYACTHTAGVEYKHVDGGEGASQHKEVCKTCGKVLATVDCQMTEKTAAVAPTCTKAGTTAVMECSKCKATSGGAAVKALGHNPADLSTLCPGQKCSRCNEPGTGKHSWEDNEAAEAGTKCDTCDATKPAAPAPGKT